MAKPPLRIPEEDMESRPEGDKLDLQDVRKYISVVTPKKPATNSPVLPLEAEVVGVSPFVFNLPSAATDDDRCWWSWSNCTFSTNLESYKPVYIFFVYSATIYHVVPAEDQEALENLQAKIQAYGSKYKCTIPASYIPLVDDIVIGKYSDDLFYRGKVMSVDGPNCMLGLVDYGGTMTCKVPTVIPVDDEIMQHPIYGLPVHLVGLPPHCDKININPSVEEGMFSLPFMLELRRGELIEIEKHDPYDCKLWDINFKRSLNKRIRRIARKSKSHRCR